MDEIEKRKKLEKEKFNPENRLKEIFKEGAAQMAEENKIKKNPNMSMAMWGDSSTFNMNELLRNNIKNSPYFNELFAMKSVPEVRYKGKIYVIFARLLMKSQKKQHMLSHGSQDTLEFLQHFSAVCIDFY